MNNKGVGALSEPRLRSWFVGIGNSPLLNGVAAVLSVLAGALASFFTNSIRTSLALPADPSKGNSIQIENFHWSFEATIFWILVASAAGLFGLNKFADSDIDNKHKDDLNKKLHGLESMPPDAFLEKLEAGFSNARGVYAAARASFASAPKQLMSPAQIDPYICKILAILEQLARAYDGNIDASYRVYLMRFTGQRVAEVKLKRAVYVPMLPADESRHGYLEAFTSLSVTGGHTEVSTHGLGQLEEFAVPVLRRDKSNNKRDFLPGGARAMFVGRIYECHSVPQLLAEIVEEVSDHQQDATRRFYREGPGKGVKSFISLSIPNNKWEPQSIHWQGSDVCGVVTIEADREDLLKNAAGFFCPVVQPLLYTIAAMLASRIEDDH
ncbi:hypothetical protein [Burkholderia gladioli]|uniref:hypothetical protein n=1 Tax=Burkholderia gladioli TaxID=28095 RepID=UPI00163DF863|nr:hypothetical protein [Burkholderia gladioli]